MENEQDGGDRQRREAEVDLRVDDKEEHHENAQQGDDLFAAEFFGLLDFSVRSGLDLVALERDIDDDGQDQIVKDGVDPDRGSDVAGISGFGDGAEDDGALGRDWRKATGRHAANADQ